MIIRHIEINGQEGQVNLKLYIYSYHYYHLRTYYCIIIANYLPNVSCLDYQNLMLTNYMTISDLLAMYSFSRIPFPPFLRNKCVIQFLSSFF
jgi:hypothetical protein